MNNSNETRNRTSEQIQADISVFLSAGGKIETLPPQEARKTAKTKEELVKLFGEKQLQKLKDRLKYYEERNLTLAQKRKRSLIQ